MSARARARIAQRQRIDFLVVRQAWLDTMTLAQQAILDAGKYTWSLMPDQANGNAAPRVLETAGARRAVRRASSVLSL